MARPRNKSIPRPPWAQRLEAARIMQGWSQAEAARKIGISQPRLANFEAGTREPNLQLLQAIAEQLHISLDFLIRGKRNEQEQSAPPAARKTA